MPQQGDDAYSYLQFMQALPLLRGLECLLAGAFDARDDSDITRMEEKEKKGGAWRLRMTDQLKQQEKRTIL
jgi:hypothetical protein